MPTREDALAELSRRASSGELSSKQQAAFGELQKRGVIPTAQKTSAVSPSIQKMLTDSGYEGAERLANTGITPGTASEFAVAHMQATEKRTGRRPDPKQMEAANNMFKGMAGREDRTDVDQFQEQLKSQRDSRNETAVGRASNVGLNFVQGVARPSTAVIGTVAPGYAADLREQQQQAYNPSGGFSGVVGGGLAEGANLAASLAMGPAGVVGYYGAQGTGSARTDIAERRAAGQEISGGMEFASALAQGTVEGLSGLVGGRIVQSLGRYARPLAAEASEAGSRRLIQAATREAGLVLGEGAEEAVTEIVQNAIKQKSYDPEAGLMDGVAEAFAMGLVLAPVGGALVGGATGGKKAPAPSPAVVVAEQHAEVKHAHRLSADELGRRTGTLDADTEGEVEGNQYFQRGQMGSAEGGDGDWVKVTIPLDQLTASPRSGTRVDGYAGQTADTAPPLVAGIMKEGDGSIEIIDGNNRHAAAIARGDTTAEVYVPDALARRFQPLGLPSPLDIAQRELGDAETAVDRAQQDLQTAAGPSAGAIQVDPSGRAGTDLEHDALNKQASAAIKPQYDPARLLPDNAPRFSADEDGSVSDNRVEEKRSIGLREGRQRVDDLTEAGKMREAKKEIERLKKEARTDPLTRIGNKRAFDEKITKLKATVEKTGRSRKVAFFDLGNLKVANTILGHEGANSLLVSITKKAENALKGRADIFRTGGDEFIVVPKRSMNEKQTRQLVAEVEAAVGHQDLVPGKVSAFIAGDVATLEPGGTVAEELDAADKRSEGRKSEIKQKRGETTTRAEAEVAVAEFQQGVVTHSDSVTVTSAVDSARRNPEAVLRVREANANLRAKRRAVQQLRGQGELSRLVAEYKKSTALDQGTKPHYKPISPAEGRSISRAYETMQHDPTNPDVILAYESFKKETLDQFLALQDAGFTFDLRPVLSVAELYPSVTELATDVLANKSLSVNADPGDMPSDHPMAQEVGPLAPGWTHNQVFRAVHDVIGHVNQGHAFTIEGEENAWRDHSTTYSDAAKGALATETRGQSSWVGYGPHGAVNRKAVAEDRIEDVTFPGQKAGLLPEQYWTAPGTEAAAAPVTDPDVFIQAVAPGIERIPGKSRVKEGISRVGVPVSAVLRNWSPRLYGKLKTLQARYKAERHDADTQVQNMTRQLNAVLDRRQRLEFDYAVSTQDFDTAHNMLREADPTKAEDVWQQFELVQRMKDNVYAEAKGIGMKIGYRQQHMPRAMKPGAYDSWYEARHGVEPDELQRALAEESRRLGRDLTDTEKVHLANQWLAGWNPRKPGQTTPRIAGLRSVDDLTIEEFQKFYQPLDQALFSYFDRMIYNVHKAKLFGKDVGEESLDQTIGRIMIDQSHGIDRLNSHQKRRMRSIINSIFTTGEQSPAKALRAIRDLGYMGTLLDPSSAAIQFGDLAMVAARDGVGQALKSIPASMRETVLTAKNLGLQHISAEYGAPGALTKALNRGFKVVGFTKVDTAMKTVNMVSSFQKAQRLLKNPDSKAYRAWEQQWAPVFGEAEFADLKRDLSTGLKSDLVTTYAYMDLSETQPIDMLEMPQYYLDHPNGRVMYQLKTFALRQFGFIRGRAYDKIAKGVRNSDYKMAGAGLRELVQILMMLSLSGMTFDMIRDWITGKNVNPRDSFVDGLLATHLGSTYLLDNASSDGPGSAAVDFLTPPAVGMVNRMTKDAMRGEYKSLKYLPFGKMVYGWTPSGQAEVAKYGRKDVLSAASSAYADGDRAAASTYVKAFNDAMKSEGREERLTMSSVRQSAARRNKEDKK